MIVTFDTSILVRANKRSNGPVRREIDAVASNPDQLMALSSYILGEGKVLNYPRMQALFRLKGEIHDHVRSLQSISRIVEPVAGLPVVLGNPGDDPVVYTAVASRADVLCERDRHFYDRNVIKFCSFENIRTMDDLELLVLLPSGGRPEPII